MAGRVAVALTNLLWRTVARLALQAFGMLAAGRLDAGVGICVPVTLANLLRRAFLGLSGQVFRLPAAILSLIAAHFGAPFVLAPAPLFGSSSLSISSRHAARVSSFKR